MTSCQVLLLLCAVASSGLLAQTFTDVSEPAGIAGGAVDAREMAGGVVWFDYNNDFYPDLLLVNGTASPRLYRNDWDGTFTDVSESAGLLGLTGTMGAVSADFDGDGYPDLFFTTRDGQANRLLRNLGGITFKDISRSAGIIHPAYSAAATVGDPDGDGDPDVYVANYLAGAAAREGGQPNFLYRNDGQLVFTEVAAAQGVADPGCGLGATFSDFDLDGREDLYLANDFGYLVRPNEMFRNEAAGFRATAAGDGTAATINAMGIATGDFDNDGDQDLYVTNIRENPLFENIGAGRYFSYVTDRAAVGLPELTGWGTTFADFDRDGSLDLVVANGEITETDNQPQPLAFLHNTGDGRFSDRSAPSGLGEIVLRGRGLAVADFDLDGRPDLAVNAVGRTEGQGESARLLRNSGTGNAHWLAVAVPFGVLRLTLHAAGRQLTREVDGGSSYLSHSAGPLHFGAPASTGPIDSLTVVYTGGRSRTVRALPWDGLVGLDTDGGWYRIVHERELRCATEAAAPSVATAWLHPEREPKTLSLTRMETRAFERLSPETVELRTGDLYRGVARTQDAVFVDTLPQAGGCPVLQPINLRVLPRRERPLLYPNPGNGALSIELPTAGGWLRVDLLTSTGALARTEHREVAPGSHRITLSLGQLPRGTYVCRLSREGGITYHKLIRQ